MKKSIIIVTLLLLVFTTVISDFSFAEKEKFDNWREVALAMSEQFDKAIEEVEKGNNKQAREYINEAYFGYYEIQGFEKNVMVYIATKRVNHIEGMFRDIKHTLLGNMEGDKESIIRDINALRVKVYKDAMVLDGIASAEDSDKLGEEVFGDQEIPDWGNGDTEAPVAKDKAVEKDATEQTSQVSAETKNWITFTTSFSILLREGLEAILVIVAIIAYLIKTGNKALIKHVYIGSIAAIVASILLAFFIEFALGNSGVARELIEGWTMFLAVIVLFYVSNWMLSKSEHVAFEKYIDEKVASSIDNKSKWTLVFAAFLAVLREGAELILFYKAAFASGMSSPKWIGLGILAATVLLAAIYIAFRYFSVKLPLKPFFMFTSLLLFLMCISFMGKGVIELTEANVISGRTIIPAMNGFSIEILNIYDRAETLIPQIMLVIAAAYLFIKHLLSAKKETK